MNDTDEKNLIIAEGKWGTCTWIIDGDYNLIIDGGVGDSLELMNSSPWKDYRENITTVCFSHEVVMKEAAALSYMFYNF